MSTKLAVIGAQDPAQACIPPRRCPGLRFFHTPERGRIHLTVLKGILRSSIDKLSKSQVRLWSRTLPAEGPRRGQGVPSKMAGAHPASAMSSLTPKS